MKKAMILNGLLALAVLAVLSMAGCDFTHTVTVEKPVFPPAEVDIELEVNPVRDVVLTVEPVAYGFILSWPPVLDALSYDVWRSTGGREAVKVATVPVVTNRMTRYYDIVQMDGGEPTLESETAYTYTVFAKAYLDTVRDSSEGTKTATSLELLEEGTKIPAPGLQLIVDGSSRKISAQFSAPDGDVIFPVGLLEGIKVEWTIEKDRNGKIHEGEFFLVDLLGSSQSPEGVSWDVLGAAFADADGGLKYGDNGGEFPSTEGSGVVPAPDGTGSPNASFDDTDLKPYPWVPEAYDTYTLKVSYAGFGSKIPAYFGGESDSTEVEFESLFNLSDNTTVALFEVDDSTGPTLMATTATAPWTYTGVYATLTVNVRGWPDVTYTIERSNDDGKTWSQVPFASLLKKKPATALAGSSIKLEDESTWTTTGDYEDDFDVLDANSLKPDVLGIFPVQEIYDISVPVDNAITYSYRITGARDGRVESIEAADTNTVATDLVTTLTVTKATDDFVFTASFENGGGDTVNGGLFKAGDYIEVYWALAVDSSDAEDRIQAAPVFTTAHMVKLTTMLDTTTGAWVWTADGTTAGLACTIDGILPKTDDSMVEAGFATAWITVKACISGEELNAMDNGGEFIIAGGGLSSGDIASLDGKFARLELDW